MTITHLAYRLAHRFNGGVVALSIMMGKGEKVLASKLNPNCDTHHLNIEEFAMEADFVPGGNLEAAQFFADKVPAIVVLLPAIPDDSDMGLLDGYMEIMCEFGKLSSEFQKAYSDGDIDQREFERIARDVGLVQAKLLAWQASVKRVVR